MKWREFVHHAYIVAIAADGDALQFENHLQKFNEAYTDIRNPIIHRGGSFIELNVEPATISSYMMRLANSCISSIVKYRIETVEELHIHAINSLKTPEFEQVLSDFMDRLKEAQPDRKLPKIPW